MRTMPIVCESFPNSALPDNDPDTQQIKDLISQGALVVFNHSGGKDSQSMMIKLLEVVPRAQILVVHASLGRAEWEGAMELGRDQAADVGVPFIVARATKTLMEMVLHRFNTRPEVPSWPPSASRQCTSAQNCCTNTTLWKSRPVTPCT
jgi:3'-phosphoadenosine 5'-phosphosulfate sulfotransferase (PAPS reductase)/FAD synthetase